MELGQLKHFLAVIDAGSVGDAARKLGMSQGAMSNSIRALERSLKTSLFERSPRGMRLTPAGESLEARARIISAEAQVATEELGLFSRGLKGRISFAVGASTSHALLPRAIERFYRTHPQIQLSISEGYFGSLCSQLEAGDLEFGLFMLVGGEFTGLATERFARRNNVVVLTSAKNPRRFRGKMTLKDIWSGPWILNRDYPGLRGAFAEAFRKAGLPAPVPAIEITAGTVPLEIALANPEFMFIAPELFTRDDVEAGRLQIVPVHVPGMERELTAYYRKGSILSPAARSFLSVFRQVVDEAAKRRVHPAKKSRSSP